MHSFHVPNMTCGGCARSVTYALKSVDEDAKIETNPSAREVKVDSSLDRNVFVQVLSEAGYPVQQ
ncbi:heavy-metal-associated domain-containing protein [Pseudomonas arcuscaelestis]|jgi:copper chaperone|uniref:heavy-metal-associated domain-containing protein n=1 Tax=Pseudomonas arcuscaelestis TaxID=2710591 RepID=UPI00193D5540|nr:heavy-metal-associated domain-containing protein [Pseudomonas arcuscaelestis]MBM3104072.1 heavy-metal-associated domain-containing protein [Pseudomonas arcuscaelestis]MBM3112270.1 heavy-metal-associated domain-containing protein [Pseudomonas arcuscaelestis]